jgi:hypothetical protein
MPDDELEREIDRLYAGPPGEFTRERDALAKRAKAGRDAEGAARVRALRKPVRSAWAVNRLVRQERRDVEDLIDVGKRLRTAQQRALSGAGADELRDLSEERRKLVAALTQRAVDLLGDDEPAASLAEDVAATLEAASIDDDAAALVLAGRLAKPLPRPAGFGDVVGLRSVPGGASRAPAPSAAEERAERRRHDRDLRAAEDRERKARQRVDRLRAEIETLQTRVAKKKEELHSAEAEARGAAVDGRRLRR